MDLNNYKKSIALRHELHAHPELSNHEVWTKKCLMDFIRTNTSLEIVDKGDWFYAVYHSIEGKKNIGFRADYDALPIDEAIELPYGSKNKGVSHKCGHDGHAASLAGLALELEKLGSPNNLFLLFQPAEETGDGAEKCLPFIEENHIDEIYAYHNMSGMEYKSINVIDGTAHCASIGMTIEMTGTPSHASEPEKGRNPAFAIAKLIESVPELTAPENNRGLVLCTVVQVAIGEKAFGVSASKGRLLLTIRALYDDELLRLKENLEKMAVELGEDQGLKVNFCYNDCFPGTVNHKECSNKIREAAKSKGLKLNEMSQAFRCSEDFGWYTKHTKGAIFFVGNGEDYPAIHTCQYDFRDGVIEAAVEVFKALAEVE
jgi:amidohydrolase